MGLTSFDAGLMVTAHNNGTTATAVFNYNNLLSLGYVAPPFTVGVNAKSTSDTSPSLTGTISDTAASVSVRVYNGSYYTYYAATNNGDGTWSLPRGDISTLANGTYDLVVAGVNTSGIVAFNTTATDLIVDTTSPTVTITAPSSGLIPAASIPITFSEPVQDFSLQNLHLTFTPSGSSTATEPLEAATLTTTNDQNWTLGNLSGLTSATGAYSLTLSDAGGGVTDADGNVLATNASATWIMGITTTTTLSSSQPSAVYGTPPSFTATVTAPPSSGEAPGQGSVEFYDTTPGNNYQTLGAGTYISSSTSAPWTSTWILTGLLPKTFNVASADTITATYFAGTGFANSSGTTTQTITTLAITVTAVANTKTYDGTTSAAHTPTITGSLVGSDTAAFTETYNNKNAGTGKTLTPVGSVNDGNGGANYLVTTVTSTAAAINQAGLTITALSNTKTYDGTASAAITPTVTGLADRRHGHRSE